MSVQQVDKSGWTIFFDTFTRTLVGKRAEIEVASLDIGDQIEAEWAPLIGITYDHKDDLIEVAVEGVDHLIKAGIVDPAKVVKSALRNAASIAGLMLTTQVLITKTDSNDGKEKKKVEGAIR